MIAPTVPSLAAPAEVPRARRVLRAAPALLGGVLAVTGALLPWLTFFTGLRALAGVRGLYGWLVLIAGVSAFTLGVAHLRDGERRHLRYAGVVGLALLALMVWVVPHVLATVTRLQKSPMLLPAAGPGAFVALGAGVLTALSLRAGKSGSRGG